MRTITSQRDFNHIFAQGIRSQANLVRVVVARSSSPEGRVAFVAPKRLGHAVLRNRCKRVLRACAVEAGLPKARRDVIVLATRGVATAPHNAVVKALTTVLAQAEKRLARRESHQSDSLATAAKKCVS